MRSRLLAVRFLAVLAVGGGAAIMPVTSTSAAVTAGSVVPDEDPFYAAPADIDSYAPGAVVASRTLPAWVFGGPLVVNAWQISYRTNDSHDNAELAVTTLVVPKQRWLGAGPRPVISLQSPEDSLGTQCAPSYLIATNRDFQEPALGGDALLLGYALAIPDHEGPKSAFIAGPQEGHAVLDGVRAVRNFNHAGIGTANPWALSGYSGGAHATGWAVQLQPSYAPDVHLVGAAMGGTPADPAATGRYLDGGAGSGLEFAAAYGIRTEWPEAGIDSILNDKGRAAMDQLRGKCEADIVSQFAFRRLADYSTQPDPLSVPSVKAVLDLDTLGATAPGAPVYDYHANPDEIVPVAQDNTLVAQWCAQGATVTVDRDPVGDHLSEAAVRAPSVLLWLKDRFSGKAARNDC